MTAYFGTDGIRGIANGTLTHEIAFKCGNALTMIKKHPKIVICKDTRVSGDLIIASVTSGVLAGGGNVINCGVLPTAGLSYICKKYNAHYGIVVSASHNPYEYNGIKIFDSDGCKLSEEQEEEIEGFFSKLNLKTGNKIGTNKNDEKAQRIYEDYLFKTLKGDLSGVKVVLDCAYGAAYEVAPSVFDRLKSDVDCFNCDITKGVINDGCGSLYPDTIRGELLLKGADIGFAFDGDSDRVIACDEKGNLIDGDMLIYMLAVNMQSAGRLKGNVVVGTSHTNLGIQKALEAKGIKLLRADIGDKYVRELMKTSGAVLGGEQSGHIIIGDLSDTGDGILSAIQVCGVVKESGKRLSELCDAKLYPQVNINIKVKDKLFVLNSELLQSTLDECRKILGKKGRVMVRASGTEPKIRVMTECEDNQTAKETAEMLQKVILELADN